LRVAGLWKSLRTASETIFIGQLPPLLDLNLGEVIRGELNHQGENFGKPSLLAGSLPAKRESSFNHLFLKSLVTFLFTKQIGSKPYELYHNISFL